MRRTALGRHHGRPRNARGLGKPDAEQGRPAPACAPSWGPHARTHHPHCHTHAASRSAHTCTRHHTHTHSVTRSVTQCTHMHTLTATHTHSPSHTHTGGMARCRGLRTCALRPPFLYRGDHPSCLGVVRARGLRKGREEAVSRPGWARWPTCRERSRQHWRLRPSLWNELSCLWTRRGSGLTEGQGSRGALAEPLGLHR